MRKWQSKSYERKPDLKRYFESVTLFTITGRNDMFFIDIPLQG